MLTKTGLESCSGHGCQKSYVRQRTEGGAAEQYDHPGMPLLRGRVYKLRGQH
jgi:hypothetical protein